MSVADPSGWRALAGLAVLLAAQLAFTLVPLRVLDPGFDEVAHVGAAYHLAAEGRDALNREHPTLAKRVAALGLEAGPGVPEPLDPGLRGLDQWDLGTRVLYAPDRGVEALRAARAPFVALGLALTLVAFCWAWHLAGPLAAFGAAASLALSPMLHAHGAMVLTDLPLALFSLAGAACAWAALERRSWAWAAAAGAAAALAMHAKYPGVVAAAVVIGTLCVAPGIALREARVRVRLLAAAIGAFAVAFVLCLDGDGLAAYRAGLAQMGTNYLGDYRYYLMGTGYAGRHLGYFPATMLLKSSAVELAGIALALPLAAWLAVRRRFALLALLFAFPAAYLSALALGAQNFGHRYTLPLYGFLAVVLALAVAGAPARMRALLVGAIAALQLATAVVATPDPLSYFNGLLGCRGRDAWRCLDDSNIDWGQNVTRVQAEIARRGIPRGDVLVDLPFIHDPGVLAGLAVAQGSDWQRPRPAYYVVSAHMMVRRMVHDPGIRGSELFDALQGADYFAGHFFLDLRARPGPPGDPIR